MSLSTVPTPCLLLDKARLTVNCDRMKQRAAAAGVRLRPHLKTLKCAEAADLAVDASRSIAVSTLVEAEFFARRGFEDVMVAVCLSVPRLARAIDLAASLPHLALSVLVEDESVSSTLVELAHGRPARLGVWIEVDCGEHRTGFDPDDDALVRTADLLRRSPGLQFHGVATHAGQSYKCRSVEEVRAVAHAERDAAVHAARRLVEAGLPCPSLSVGSTPTAVFGTSWDGITELRPGVYMAGDLFQQQMGTVGPQDLALSVLCTVVSSRPGRCVVDAGGLALSKDRSLLGAQGDPGYGEVIALDGQPLGWCVRDVHQEHGEIALPSGIHVPVGTLLRILPVHACMTAAAHAGYHVTEGAEVTDYWPRAQGWN